MVIHWALCACVGAAGGQMPKLPFWLPWGLQPACSGHARTITITEPRHVPSKPWTCQPCLLPQITLPAAGSFQVLMTCNHNQVYSPWKRCGKKHGSRSRPILAATTCCMSLDASFNLSEPPCAYLYRNNHNTYLRGLL